MKINALAGEAESTALMHSAKKLLKRDVVERLEDWMHSPATEREHITKVKLMLQKLGEKVKDKEDVRYGSPRSQDPHSYPQLGANKSKRWGSRSRGRRPLIIGPDGLAV